MGKHDWKFKGYVEAKKAVIFSLARTDLKVYLVLLAHYNAVTGACFPSISTIAHEAGLSEATVKRSRNRLKGLGLVNWIVDRRFRNAAMYDFPFEHSSDSERARITQGLKVRSPVNLPIKRKKKFRRLGHG
jgi:predicted transcriptional regulator